MNFLGVKIGIGFFVIAILFTFIGYKWGGKVAAVVS